MTFTINDGNLTQSEVVHIAVTNLNQSPIFDNDGAGSGQGTNNFSGYIGQEGSPIVISVSATDFDNDQLTYTTDILPNGAHFDVLARVFSWTPDYTQSGTYSVTFHVSDNHGGTDSKTVSLSIEDTNRAPMIDSIGSKNMNENNLLTFAVPVSDPDGDTFSVAAVGLPAGATFLNNTFSWTPNFDQSGLYSVTFTATDSKRLSSDATVSISIVNTNRAPELSSIKNSTIDQGETLNMAVFAADADGDVVHLSAESLPQGAAFTDNNNASADFNWTPDPKQFGSFTINIIATDSHGDSQSKSMTITVNKINEAPELNFVSAKTIDEGKTLSFKLIASDANEDVITYSSSILPSGSSFNKSTGEFSWTPDFTQAGNYLNIYFQAMDSDGAYSSLITTQITVNDVNRAPNFSSTKDQSTTEEDPLSFDISASDPDADIITYSAQNLPDGATFNTDAQNKATFKWTPDLNAAGNYQVTFIASDGKDSSTMVISISVQDKVFVTISNLSVTTTAYSATISFNTNVPSISQIEYGKTTGYGSTSNPETKLVTKHKIILTGMLSNTLYHYAIRSTDALGNQNTSTDHTVTTKSNRTSTAYDGTTQTKNTTLSTGTTTTKIMKTTTNPKSKKFKNDFRINKTPILSLSNRFKY